MENQAVHWGEGLFLRPHHFQAAERSLRDEVRIAEDWNVSYAYGLREIDIDQDALTNWQVSLRSCHARLHDGTHIRFPEIASIDHIPLPKDAFDRRDRILVYLALPTLKLGRKNSDVVSGDPNCRYSFETVEVEDENQSGKAQMLDVRRPNVRLLLETDDISGFQTIPIMRLRRGTTAEAPPEIDPDFIPPLLACDAWSILQNDIIGNIYNQIGGMIELLSAQMVDRGVAFESGHREDLERIFKLLTLNTASGLLNNLPFVRGVHPLTAYTDLCGIVGMLAIFRPERGMPDVPKYDHDDLGRCFYAIKKLIQFDAPGKKRESYIKRPFEGAGLQLQIRLESEWLQPDWSFYIGVHSELNYHQCVSMLRGELDMKVGSTAHVETIFTRGQPGVQLIPQPEVPRLLPGKNWTYWKVERDSLAWAEAEKSFTLAIRMNHQHFVGQIDRQQKIQVLTDDNRELTMAFVLYALPTAAEK